jgi:phage FluMu protein Com
MSEGVFNKICPNCRTLNENVSPLALPENFPLHQPEK